MAKRKKGPMNVMKEKDMRARKYLLEEWGYACIICGERFANLACVTKEHVVPRSVCVNEPSKKPEYKNLAPSHHVCNKLRQTDSLLVAAQRVEFIRQNMKPEAFWKWLNTPVPHRTVPKAALMPIHVPECLGLPEHLPGMR